MRFPMKNFIIVMLFALSMYLFGKSDDYIWMAVCIPLAILSGITAAKADEVDEG
jgi:hypothetical protein